MSASGYFALVLHAHLPFVRHSEVPDFLEEDWYYEAVVETYVPLLSRFERLRDEKIPFQLTMTVSPTLASMMDDDLLSSRLRHYLDKRIELLEREVNGNRGTHVEKIAGHYLDEFRGIRSFVFDRYQGKILRSFRSLLESGHLDIITCTATHGLLPLMSGPAAQQAQVETAVRTHKHYFGVQPRGIWLAECGYDDGVDSILANAGIEYFFMDTHGILFGDPQPAFGVYAPVITERGVNAFARDPESSKQVWSQKEGYPGDANYREFYRDLGYDADWDYIKPYQHSDQIRRGVGIKYHKITGSVDLGSKEFYDPEKGRQKAIEHAKNFLFNRQLQVRHLRERTKDAPIIVAPYDAELFGHWWYEGPTFLEEFIRASARDQNDYELSTCGRYIDTNPIRQIQRPNPSTWGSEGHNLVWLNGGNAALYRHQHWSEKKMEELAQHFPHAEGDLRRALNQLLRELLLLQSSDWAFIFTTGTTVPYATRRFREHAERFRKLASQIEGNSIDTGFLGWLEQVDGLFPTVDYRDILLKSTAPVLA